MQRRSQKDVTAEKQKAKWQHSILHREDNIAQRHFKSSVIGGTILFNDCAQFTVCTVFGSILLLSIFFFFVCPQMSMLSFRLEANRSAHSPCRRMPNRYFSASRHESEKLATRASFHDQFLWPSVAYHMTISLITLFFSHFWI